MLDTSNTSTIMLQSTVCVILIDCCWHINGLLLVMYGLSVVCCVLLPSHRGQNALIQLKQPVPGLNVNLNKENNFIFGKGKLNSVTRADQVTVEYLRVPGKLISQLLIKYQSSVCGLLTEYQLTYVSFKRQTMLVDMLAITWLTEALSTQDPK